MFDPTDFVVSISRAETFTQLHRLAVLVGAITHLPNRVSIAQYVGLRYLDLVRQAEEQATAAGVDLSEVLQDI